MDTSRNDYGEVCVYCHTPHSASTTELGARLPLWNRTIKTTAFTTYSSLNSTSISQTITQPGAASIACLTCHDGQTAIDSIINMPGSGNYLKSQETSTNNDFLESWGPVPTGFHATMTECAACHNPTGPLGTIMPTATDFTVFIIGTDLSNDHPVGIVFPTANTDFATTTGTQGNAKFFDRNGNGRMNKDEVRVYASGEGFEVECASCHDPHGVPTGGGGSANIPSFLRVNNTNDSALCLTCHMK